jgi:hypothetical protein
MKIIDHAVKLEQSLLERFTRRSDVSLHPLEVYRKVLDAIEDATEPGVRGGRIFPYHSVTVLLPTTDSHHRATAEALFAEPPSLEARVRARLRQAGCADADSTSVTLKLVDGTDAEWSGHDYRLEFRRRTHQPARALKRRVDASRELQLAVLAGKAARSRYSFSAGRLNLGRLADVVDRQHRVVRQNHVAFLDAGDEVSQSISRTHAHIDFDATTGEARLHDDGSTHGTRVVRDGRTLSVPRGGRGVVLRDGDEIVLGQARVRVASRRTTRR